MRRQVVVFLLLIALAFLVASFIPWASADIPPKPMATGSEPNRLANPGFEEGFSFRHDPYSGQWAGELEVGNGWELWYNNAQQCPPYDPGCNPYSYNRRPEYKPEPTTGHVHSGQKAQKFFTTYGTHQAGLYQVLDVPAHSWVRFSAWVWVWSSQQDNPNHSFEPGDYAVAVGINPKGSVAWDSGDIVWSKAVQKYDQWVYLEVDAFSETGHLSVWLRGRQVWPVKHNDSYWDDGKLIVLGEQPQPTPMDTPTRTPYPTPPATPPGYVPPQCIGWQPLWNHDFSSTALNEWGRDPSAGSVQVLNGALWLKNGASPYESFPLAWSMHAWPTHGNLRLAFRFAYHNLTGYGTTIGVGSEAYQGERTLAGEPDTWGIDNILKIHFNASQSRITLLGQNAWTGTPGDTTWHSVQLDLYGTTYVLSVDGSEVKRGVSYWRPRSLYLGNPVIQPIAGMWSEVGLDDLRLSVCSPGIALPLVHNGVPSSTPTATNTFTPEPSATPTDTPTPTTTSTPSATLTLTPSATASS